jgi:hypothetical protein
MVLKPMPAHRPLLIREDVQVATRFGCAKQYEVRFAICGEERIGLTLVHSSVQKATRTGQTSALMADCRKFDSYPSSGIPDELVMAACKRALAFTGFQDDIEVLRLFHAAT